MRSRARNRLQLVIACALVIAAASSLRAAPDEQAPARVEGEPTTAASTRPHRGGGGGDGDRVWGGGFGRRGPGDNWREQPAPTPEEWEEIETFMRENSPVRLTLYERIEAEMGLERMVTQVVRRRIAARYRDLQQMKERNNELYEFAYKQMRIEDETMATLLRIHKEGETPELTAQLKSQMRSFVDNWLSEREARLNGLRAFVGREEANIAKDRGNLEQIEQKQRERFERDMRRMLDFSSEEAPTSRPAAER